VNKLPVVSGDEVIRALVKIGFRVIRQRGSHVYLKHQDGRSTVVPAHKGTDLDRGLLKKILRDTEISREEFKKLL